MPPVRRDIVSNAVPSEIAIIYRFWRKVNRNGPVLDSKLGRCWVWTASLCGGGYGQLGICVGKHIGAHCFSWILHNGENTSGLQVQHKCDNKLCVNPSHLKLGDTIENSMDAVARGQIGVGESRYNSKVTEEIVMECLCSYIPGSTVYGQSALSRKYDVKQSTIWAILNGKSWKHVYKKWIALGKPTIHKP